MLLSGEMIVNSKLDKQPEQQNERNLRVRLRNKPSVDLDQAGSALRIISEVRILEKMKIERAILLNLKQTVEPYIEKLKGTSLTDRQKRYVELIETALKNVASPLLSSFATSDLKLTPAEIQVSNLLKFGKNTKEIAEITNVSLRTVQSHRRNIRKKFGLSGRKANLRFYLLQSEENNIWPRYQAQI